VRHSELAAGESEKVREVERRAKPVVVSGLVAPAEAAMAWRVGEREEQDDRLFRAVPPNHSDWAMAALLAGRLSRNTAEVLYTGWPEEVLRPVLHQLSNYPRANADEDNGPQWRLAVRFGVDALPALLATARRHPRYNVEPLMPFAAGEVAVQMADWYARLRSLRAAAVAWFTRHPAVAARALVPPALGKAGKARRQAENVLRLLVAEGFGEHVRAAASGYGPQAEAGVDTLLRTDLTP
jgi:hypothetical protein